MDANVAARYVFPFHQIMRLIAIFGEIYRLKAKRIRGQGEVKKSFGLLFLPNMFWRLQQSRKQNFKESARQESTNIEQYHTLSLPKSLDRSVRTWNHVFSRGFLQSCIQPHFFEHNVNGGMFISIHGRQNMGGKHWNFVINKHIFLKASSSNRFYTSDRVSYVSLW